MKRRPKCETTDRELDSGEAEELYNDVLFMVEDTYVNPDFELLGIRLFNHCLKYGTIKRKEID